MTDEFGEAVLYAVGKRFGDDKDSRIGFEEWNLLDMDDFSRVMESLVKKSLRAKLASQDLVPSLQTNSQRKISS